MKASLRSRLQASCAIWLNICRTSLKLSVAESFICCQFTQLLRRLLASADLAAIAAELGYADHAHLTNDFQRYLGFTPSTYRRIVADDVT